MLEIRQAAYSDLALIVSWTTKLHTHEDDGSIEVHENFSDNLFLWLKNELENSNSLFLIACDGATPMGFISGTSSINDNGLLKHSLKGIVQILWVEKPFRKMGVASQLLQSLTHCFQETGINYLECSYTLKNKLGRNFWLQNGFVENSITARKLLSAPAS